jgi:hypothetical protein
MRNIGTYLPKYAASLASGLFYEVVNSSDYVYGVTSQKSLEVTWEI